MLRLVVLLPALLLLCSAEDGSICNDYECPTLQKCCDEGCCIRRSTTVILSIAISMVALSFVAGFVGICLYLKNKVHKDSPYTVDDLESMYSRSLKKSVSFRGEIEMCAPEDEPEPTPEPPKEPTPEPEPVPEPEPAEDATFPRGLTEKKSRKKKGAAVAPSGGSGKGGAKGGAKKGAGGKKKGGKK
eukprot:sb/3471306/